MRCPPPPLGYARALCQGFLEANHLLAVWQGSAAAGAAGPAWGALGGLRTNDKLVELSVQHESAEVEKNVELRYADIGPG